MPASSVNHFTTGAAGYAAHRPTYPMALADALAAISPGHALALDCGCGTGQLSVLLAERFEAVVALDASAAQIAQAEAHERVRYGTALAQDSGLPAASVDLVTVAQAAHWLDLDLFYDEVRRVARPGAAVALVTYGILQVDGDEVDRIARHFYHEVVGPHWPPERRHVEEGYRNLPFPFREHSMPELAIEVAWTVADLVGYVNTWSAVRVAERALGASPVPAFEAALRAAWGDPESRRRVRWPLSVRAGNVEGPSS